MTKSLEALERINFNINESMAMSYYAMIKYEEDYLTIKQDLERLQQLEKENQELVVNKNLAQGVAIKYKKVIDILKDKVVFEFFEPKDEKEMKECLEANEELYLIRMGEDWFTLDDKNKFDLLKEVLNNE